MPEPKVARETAKMLRDSIKPVLSLEEGKLRKINEWAKSHKEAWIKGELINIDPQMAGDEIGVSRSEFVSALSVLLSIVLGFELRTSDIESHNIFKELGVEDAQTEQIKILFDGIEATPKEAEIARQRGIAIQTAIPVLADVDVMCDLRGIFRRFPSPNPSPQHTESIKVFLDFEPMALVSIETVDEGRNNKVCIFQTTEQGLRCLLETLQNALIQLEIVKKQGEAITVNGEKEK